MATSPPGPIRVPSSDGVEVTLHDLGGRGPLLLVSHATGFHGRAYGPLAEELGTDYHSFGADLRGHGDTAPPASLDFAWRGFGNDVGAVVDHLGSRPLFGFGHSMGGAALVMAELARPGRFSALYLFEPILPPPLGAVPRESHMSIAARRRREVFDSFEAAIERYGSRPPLDRLRPDALEAYVRHGFESLPDGTVRLKCRSEYEALTFEHSGGHDTRQRLGELTVPVTVAGGNDGQMPALIAEGVASDIPDGRFEYHADLDHFGPFTHPDRVAERVRAAFGEASGS